MRYRVEQVAQASIDRFDDAAGIRLAHVADGETELFELLDHDH